MEAGSLFICRTLLFIARTLLSLLSLHSSKHLGLCAMHGSMAQHKVELCSLHTRTGSVLGISQPAPSGHLLLTDQWRGGFGFVPGGSVSSFSTLQLDSGSGNSRPCPPLDCLKRWQSDHMCRHPHRFSELATESGMGSSDWNASMVENSCGCTALAMSEWRPTTEQIDWRAKQPSQVACFSEMKPHPDWSLVTEPSVYFVLTLRWNTKMFKRTLIYFGTDTQSAHFQGNPLCHATKWHLNNR